MGRQGGEENPIVVAKFFNPTGGQTWFATEYDSKDKIFFGYVSLFNDHNNEWGDFSLDELESWKGQFGLGIERDRFGKEKTIDEWKKEMTIV